MSNQFSVKQSADDHHTCYSSQANWKHGGGVPQNGVKYGSDWVTENLVVSLVLHCDC